MTFVIIMILIAVGIFAFKVTATNRRGTNREMPYIGTAENTDKLVTRPKPTVINKSKIYKKKPLTIPEEKAYWKITKSLPSHIVLPQVSFSRFLFAKGGSKKENFSLFSTARQKVADFVICTKDFSIVAIIEIDDKSHNREKDAQRDSLLNKAGIKVLRWTLNNLPSEPELQKIVTGM